MAEQVLPLTNSQMLIWTGQQLAPDAPIYNMAFRFEIAGRVDRELFRDAFEELVSSSDAMRIILEMDNGTPFQKISAMTTYARLKQIDLSQAADPRRAALEWCDQGCQRPFQLDECLFDSALLKLSENRFVWYLCMHHLVSDAISFQVAFHRLGEIYEQLANETPRSLPSRPEFRDFVDFEHTRQRKSPASSRDTTSTTGLFGEPSRGTSHSSQRQRCWLDSKTITRLDDLAKRGEARSLSRDLSRFNIYATLLFAFLHRVSGQHDLTIGSPFHNRGTTNFRNTIGLFIELFPISVSVAEGETFLSLLQKVKIATNRFLQCATTETPSTTDRYNVVFNFIPADFGSFGNFPVETEWLHPGASDRQHVLRMHFQQFDGVKTPAIKFDFNQDVFASETQTSALQHFADLAVAMVSDWKTQIADIELSNDFETAQLACRDHMPETQSMIAEFQRWAVETPQAPALICGTSTIRFDELDRWTNAIASRLKQVGVPEHGNVVVALSRSPEYVAAILGVLKAGAAFVPVDPKWPAKRIDTVVEKTRANCLIHTGLFAPRIEESLPRVVIEQVESEPVVPFETTTIPLDRRAYILFTSGSTGNPKGVEISHRALANYAKWASRFYDRQRKLAFPLFTPTTFDLTITSIFVPLVSGGTIVAYPENGNTQADVSLLDVVQDNRVDIIKLTPAHLGLLTDRDLSNSRVRQLILGGENLATPLAKRAQRIFGGRVQIHNEYGPTEATVGCIVHTFDIDKDRKSSVPIGRPIANMCAWILDEHQKQIPAGVPGQLYLSGIGLSDGYIGQPKLTAQSFVDHPWEPGQRLYHTGDVARWNPRGQIEFLGRIDQQVKILGARIELGEVENALCLHADISAVVAGVQSMNPRQPENIVHCQRCGLPSNYPEIKFDAESICSQCRAFENYQHRAETWFRSMEEFREIFTEVSLDDSPYDCLALLSGGKDSTYMLGQLADMGLRVLAFTLDNGYISDQAKANIRRVVITLGVDHVFGSTDSMNEIFVDSLKRHSNVCHGCFKTIYTFSTQLAWEKNIPFIVTGLSRGQFFETRLTEEVFTSPAINPDQIDQTVLEARKAYHRIDDAVSRCLDVEFLQRDETFDRVRYLDFYRYCPVDLNAMYEYLDRRLPWVRPSDTGRSTNCLINDVGIYVHKKEKGFHNYALPYSWDVRLGHKKRDAALEELNDDIDVENVQHILREIGYDDWQSDSPDRLVAWYESQRALPVQELRDHLAGQLPAYMIPSVFVHVDAIPLTANGKLDRNSLPAPGDQRTVTSTDYLPPQSDTEKTLADIWSGVLGLQQVGIHDDFFELGGDSILAIRIVARAHRMGISLRPGDLFDAPTIAELANRCQTIPFTTPVDQTSGEFHPTPIQRWYFDHQLSARDFWNQSVLLQLTTSITPERLRKVLNYLANHHDAFRQRFSVGSGVLSATTIGKAAPAWWRVVDLTGLSQLESQAVFQNVEAELHAGLTLDSQILLGGVLFHDDSGDRLLLAAHHLAVDAISWSVLLDDMRELLNQSSQGQALHLDNRPTFRHWATHLHHLAATDSVTRQFDYWYKELQTPAFCPPVVEGTTVADLSTVTGNLDSAETRQLLEHLTKQTRASIDELLMAAMFQTIAECSNHACARIFVERHGREANDATTDFSRTVGWFTSVSPATLEIRTADSAADLIRRTKEKLRQIPDKGIGYGLLRYGESANHNSHRLFPRQELQGILFNYLGATDQPQRAELLQIARPLQLHRGLTCPVLFAWQINAWIENEKLTISHDFDRRASQVGDVIESVLGTLRDWLKPGAWPKGRVVSGVDFPLANLDAKQLGKISSLLGNTRPDKDRRSDQEP